LQVEVFNKTVDKFLASFADLGALNWENFLHGLALGYNTSYHSTILTTEFELLFGEKARLPFFPMKIFNKFIMAKLWLLKDLICCKNSD
jgi:hypothetical protein